MTNIRIRQSEHLSPHPLYLPDLKWLPDIGMADLSIGNDGDLSHENALFTAVIIQLFTNLRADESDKMSETDPHGWVGDCFDIGVSDFPIGSHLWTLQRSALTDEIIRKFEKYAEIALQKLQDQQIISGFKVTVQADKSRSMLALDVTLFANKNGVKYHKRFERVWGQIYAH